jgi:cytochrome c biogenesis protein CcmG, thiol:disulfide interchange protein DsbE
MSTTKQPIKKNQQPSSRKSLIYWIVGAVVGIGLIVALAFSIAGETDVDEAIAFGEVTVEGQPLPFLQTGASDPAVGQTAPTVSGEDWEGNEYTIGPSENAKIVVMLAHWCPHCQRELPVIQNWIDSGGLPEGVELYGTTVLTNRLRDGSTWPPQEWLEEAGWNAPTIMDDQDGSIVEAYGLTGTPTYVVLGPDNENLGRLSGEIGVAGLNALAGIAADSLEG